MGNILKRLLWMGLVREGKVNRFYWFDLPYVHADAGLAFRHLLQTYRTWITEDSPESEQPVTPLSGRCYMDSTKARKLLSLFCKGVAYSRQFI